MIELLSLYQNLFPLLIISSVLLGFVGFHLAPRAQGIKTLMLTQLSLFGVMIGFLIRDEFHNVGPFFYYLIPYLAGVGTALGLGQLIERQKKSRGEIFYLVFFLIAQAACQILQSLFPGLESHYSQIYQGDIVTISGLELGISTGLMASAAVFYAFFHRQYLKRSFERELFGSESRASETRDHFEIFSVCLIVLSLSSIGTLYTMSFLLIPSLLIALQTQGLRQSLFMIALCTLISAPAGFTLSLGFERLSTVPAMIFFLVLCCLILPYLAKAIKR
jgi:ABC-type Mn2+/Zn2+ transport system permease subunit